MEIKMRTLVARMFRVNPVVFAQDIDDMLNGLKKRIILLIKVFCLITLLMLVFGDSRIIDDASVMWRIKYEWKQMFNLLLFHLR